MNPLLLIRLAANQVRAVWWFVAVGAVLAVVVILSRYAISPQALVFGGFGLAIGVVCLILMTTLIGLRNGQNPPPTTLPAMIMLWAFLPIIILSGVFTFTGFFFNWPKPLASSVTNEDVLKPKAAHLLIAATEPSGGDVVVSPSAATVSYVVEELQAKYQPPAQSKTVDGEATAVSASIIVPQKNGPFGSVHRESATVSVKVPDGAREASATAFWTTNGKESGKNASVSGPVDNTFTATGTLIGNDTSWGPRTWGELHITAKYKLDQQVASTVVSKNLPAITISGTLAAIPAEAAEGRLIGLIGTIKDKSSGAAVDHFSINLPAAESHSEQGLFVIRSTADQIVISRADE